MVCHMKKKPAPKPVDYTLHNHQESALRVEEGLPVTELVDFGREAGFTVDELAQLVHIPPRTYARRVASKAASACPKASARCA